MLWCSLVEIDLLLSVISIIIYGLLALKSKQVFLNDVYFFCRLIPLLFVIGHGVDSSLNGTLLENAHTFVSFDMLLALLLFVIMFSFKSFESVLLLLFAFIGQYYMLHSVDLLSFYIALEAQNFCFLVLCGLPTLTLTAPLLRKVVASGTGSRSAAAGFSNNSSFGKPHSGRSPVGFSVEASLKYFLLSAFSSGVLLFWFSILYLQTGNSSIYFLSIDDGYFGYNIYSYQILCAMMFKLGAAPLHLWVVQIYSNVKRQLLMYISTAPKLSLFGFWINSFHGVWTDYSLLLFSLFSLVLGSFGAYSQPGLRSLFAYSTVNEIGLMLSALEVAGFHNLMQHFGIYIISQLLLWNIEDKRLFSVLAVSLAGLPPLAGFFGKAWILWGLSAVAASTAPSAVGAGNSMHSIEFASDSHSVGLYVLLLIALFCSIISLVYYLRVLRLFYNVGPSRNTFISGSGASSYAGNGINNITRLVSYNNSRVIPTIRTIDIPGFVDFDSRVYLTSACAVALFIVPFFLIKPFVL